MGRDKSTATIHGQACKGPLIVSVCQSNARALPRGRCHKMRRAPPGRTPPSEMAPSAAALCSTWIDSISAGSLPQAWHLSEADPLHVGHVAWQLLPEHRFLALQPKYHQREGNLRRRRGGVGAEPQPGAEQDERIRRVERMSDELIRTHIGYLLAALELQADFRDRIGIGAKRDVF